MTTNTNDRLHMKHDAKTRRPRDRTVDVFYAGIDGCILDANNEGTVVAFQETEYHGGVPTSKQPRVPGNFPSLCEIVHCIEISRRTTQGP
jgi:hypothetical protein